MIEFNDCALPHGITLSCRCTGIRGRPVLMFLHGFPEAAFVWDGLLEHFARPENGGFRCIAPNLRGYGPSSAPAEVANYRPKHLMQDIAALIEHEGGPLACLVAHDWGGAVAWNLAASAPGCMEKLAIINSPHPGTFLRELQHSPAQQAASAYMNFLIRPDAEALLAEDDFRRMWEFFTAMGAADGPHAWLTDAVRAQYRDIWRAGLTGPLSYYRASPLRPPRPGPPHHDPAAAAVVIARDKLEVQMPTLVIWGLGDTALPPALLDGLEDFVPQMQLHRVEGATHWIVHEQPERVIDYLQDFLR
ncbi:alpha/beta fold hydrolase [Polaromonas sp.]|uniref:alpha/beta fold hydrolase n=1 Tax=Polaromonas sp. TaxID=1869339 RepID=UPI0013BD4E20|nr:alpha/beta fold hydrolase [Polaromonas sp.]NDP62681.1 alpha/beta fold hydrolase [Polaromonas sp.]